MGEGASLCFHYFLLLRHGHNRSRSKQFQYVVAQADQFPFRSHFLQSTEKKSAEASPLLDLSKHWFYDRLPPAVHCPSRFAHQLLFHLLPQRNRAISLGVPLFSRCPHIPMLLFPCGDIQIHSLQAGVSHLLAVPIT